MVTVSKKIDKATTQTIWQSEKKSIRRFCFVCHCALQTTNKTTKQEKTKQKKTKNEKTRTSTKKNKEKSTVSCCFVIQSSSPSSEFSLRYFCSGFSCSPCVFEVLLHLYVVCLSVFLCLFVLYRVQSSALQIADMSKNLLFWTTAGFVSGYLFNRYAFSFDRARGRSMEPTIPHNSVLLVSHCFSLKSLRPGHVVLMQSPLFSKDAKRRGQVLCKRVIACSDASLLISPVSPMNSASSSSSSSAQSVFPIRVPSNHFWVQGDNYLNSLDSRLFGSVPNNMITGHCLFVLTRPASCWLPRWRSLVPTLEFAPNIVAVNPGTASSPTSSSSSSSSSPSEVPLQKDSFAELSAAMRAYIQQQKQLQREKIVPKSSDLIDQACCSVV